MTWPNYGGLRFMGRVEPDLLDWRPTLLHETISGGGPPDYPSITIDPITVTLDDLMPRGPGYVVDETTAPVIPWANPPLGSTLGTTPLAELDPPPDYFTIQVLAAIEFLQPYGSGGVAVSEDVGLSITPSAGAYVSDLVEEEDPETHQIIGLGDGGFVIPPTHDIDPSIGDGGAGDADRLWPWGPPMSVTFAFPGRWGAVNYMRDVRVTPYWLTERASPAGAVLMVV